MEKINITHEDVYFHINMGISDERADEMEKRIKEEILSKPVDVGVIFFDDKKGTLELSATRVADYLVNKIATTYQEQLFLMMHVQTLTATLDQEIKRIGGDFISANNE